MSKVKSLLKWFLAIVIGLPLLGAVLFFLFFMARSSGNMALLGDEAPVLMAGNHSFRDLNKNGVLDIYEDSRKAVDDRVEDLLSRMTLAEKAGLMFITFTGVGPDGDLVERPTFNSPASLITGINSDLVAAKLMNHFNVFDVVAPDVLASWHNKMQKMAERTRLGIPVTIASDPRHAFGHNPAAGLPAGEFSRWPEPLGLAASRDPSIARQHGEMARQEYLATGIRLALHPMADLATEPRWARAAGTFGEDAELSARFIHEYILGFQGEELGPHSIATMVKHFSGGGPQKDGEDAHFPYGKEQVYPGDNFDYHLIPFEKGAFPGGCRSGHALLRHSGRPDI